MSIPMRICSSAEMRELDRLAEADYQIDAQMLMENAGRAAVTVLFEHYPSAGKDSEILVFAGKGNNAGDAFVVARRLICLDRKVRVFCLSYPSEFRGPTLKNFEILKRMTAKILQVDNPSDIESFFKSSNGPFLAIDGMLGTGLKGELHGIFYDVTELLNKHVQDIMALDMPSGVDGDTGAILGTSVMATLTVSFGFPKLGHFLPPGAGRRGKLVNVDISLPPRFRKEGDKFLLLKNPMAKLLKERDRYGHKNSFGHSLLIGGSPGKLGAISMAAKACHKMGTGLVTVATWPDCSEVLSIRLPDETMSVPIRLEGANREADKKNLSLYSAIIIGPGLGMRAEGRVVLEELLTTYRGPLVMDADALNLVAEHRLHDLLVKRSAPTVLTPHPGEMARLLGIPKDEVLKDPLKAVGDGVRSTHSVIVLKGAATVIGSLDGACYLNHYPNDGMATAGSGDVLAGMIGGLVGQRMDVFKAAQLGVFLHSLAGEFASRHQGHRSMTAPDIVDNIGNAFKDIKTSTAPSFPEEGRATLL